MLLDIVEYCENWFNIYTVDAVDAMTRFKFRQTDLDGRQTIAYHVTKQLFKCSEPLQKLRARLGTR